MRKLDCEYWAQHGAKKKSEYYFGQNRVKYLSNKITFSAELYRQRQRQRHRRHKTSWIKMEWLVSMVIQIGIQ